MLDRALRPAPARLLQVSLLVPSRSQPKTDQWIRPSPSMYGTVLDQRVFEHLVSRCLPSLHEHFVRTDIQLSVASLPWFLSLYISSMPMIFAFRCVPLTMDSRSTDADTRKLDSIIDCFFLMGPKVLFQVGSVVQYSPFKHSLTSSVNTALPSSSSTVQSCSSALTTERSSSKTLALFTLTELI